MTSAGRSRKWRLENPGYNKQKCREWYLANPDYKKEWLSGRPLYNTWQGMIRRCTDENFMWFRNYGGRGIKVCTRWQEYRNFVKDVGPKPSPVHTLDRINNDGDYTPSNCRWATGKEQYANRRKAQL